MRVRKHDYAFALLQRSMMTSFYFPQMVFIDRSGIIRAQYGGTDAFFQTNEEANIRNLVKQLLGTANAVAPKGRGNNKTRRKG